MSLHSSLVNRLVIGLLTTLACLSHSSDACGPGRGIGGARRLRKIPVLVFKQHVPNMSENTIGASGLAEGQITRHDRKFRDLVPNYNSDIVFKDEEGTGADRLMSQRCKEKLNTLAVSVMNEWPGVRLRVTEAWDEDMNHGVGSLHYEGRAVDITTSDRDHGKHGMLARLAVEAGFDWVYYESRSHVHCSVKSDSTQASHSSGCFTDASTVLTSSGQRRRLADLQLGESVLSMDTRTGRPVYSEVIMFMDRDSSQRRQFVHIATEGGASVTATPGHLLYVWRQQQSVGDETGTALYTYADRVEEGDHLLVYDDQLGALRPQRVTRITVELHVGVFAPLTREGTVVVDGVAASCYALVDSQMVAHWSFAPVRAWRTVQGWLAAPLRSAPIATNERRSDRPAGAPHAPAGPTIGAEELTGQRQQMGMHWYARSLYAIKGLVLPSSWMYEER